MPPIYRDGNNFSFGGRSASFLSGERGTKKDNKNNIIFSSIGLLAAGKFRGRGPMCPPYTETERTFLLAGGLLRSCRANAEQKKKIKIIVFFLDSEEGASCAALAG